MACSRYLSKLADRKKRLTCINLKNSLDCAPSRIRTCAHGSGDHARLSDDIGRDLRKLAAGPSLGLILSRHSLAVPGITESIGLCRWSGCYGQGRTTRRNRSCPADSNCLHLAIQAWHTSQTAAGSDRRRGHDPRGRSTARWPDGGAEKGVRWGKRLGIMAGFAYGFRRSRGPFAAFLADHDAGPLTGDVVDAQAG